MAIDTAGVNLTGFGYRTKEDISASTLTTDINDSGKVLNFTATCVVTLHAVAAGQSLWFRVGAAGITLTLSPNASDQISGVDLTPVDNKDIVFTSQPVGSYVNLVGGDTNGWNIFAVQGAFTRET
jgi:hypothetical protein